MSQATTTPVDRIRVQREDFSLADEYARLATRADSGALGADFAGSVLVSGFAGIGGAEEFADVELLDVGGSNK